MGSVRDELYFCVGKGTTADAVNAVIDEIGDYPDDSTWADARQVPPGGSFARDYPVSLTGYGANAAIYIGQIAAVLQERFDVETVNVDDIDPALYPIGS